MNDTIKGLNPYDKDVTVLGIFTKWLGAQTSVILSAQITYPTDTVRRRLQMESEKPVNQRIYKGTIDCFRKIISEEGVAALFKGAGNTNDVYMIGANVLRGTGAAMVLVLYGEITAFMARN